MKVKILFGRIVGVALCGLAAATINPVSADAASGLQFQKVYYDSPGSDTGSNTSLNAEWVQIKNVTSTTKYLTNWTVRDNAGHVYKFPTTKVAPGDVVRLHTGKGTNSTRHRYWGQGWYIWNNTGDKAVLRRPDGTLADSCSWTSAEAGYKSC
jgi:hypothetical protein